MNQYILSVLTYHHETDVTSTSVLVANDNNLQEQINIVLDFVKQKIDDFAKIEMIPWYEYVIEKAKNEWLSSYQTYKQLALEWGTDYNEWLNDKILSLRNLENEFSKKEIIVNSTDQIISDELLFWAYFEWVFEVELYIYKWDNSTLTDVSRKNYF